MESIKLTNIEFQQLSKELSEILSAKEKSGLKFSALDMASDIQSKLENVGKVQSELISEHGTLSEDGTQVKWNDNEGGKLWTELMNTSSELQYDGDFVTKVKDLEFVGVPIVFYKLYKNIGK